MEDGESVAASRLLPPSPNLETRQLQLLAAVTLLQGLPSTFLGRSSSRGGDVERRWGGQFSFLLQLKSLPVHLGKKEKLQNQNWQHHLCSSVQILWHLLTSVKEKCYGDKFYIPNVTKIHNYLCIWKTIVFVCVSYFGSRHLAPPLVFNRTAWKKQVNRAS